MIFSTKNIKWWKQTRGNIFICLRDHTHEPPLANIKMERQRCPEKPFILERSGTQYVAMVTKLLSSYCGAHILESYCKESNISDTNWLRYLSPSYLIKIWLSVWLRKMTSENDNVTWKLADAIILLIKKIPFEKGVIFLHIVHFVFLFSGPFYEITCYGRDWVHSGCTVQEILLCARDF